MRSVRAKAVLPLLGGVLALGLVALAWAVGAGSSEAQQDAMYNCPQAGKWAISVWGGQDGADTGDALTTCGAGAADVAYYIDPETQQWLRYFAGRAEISNLLALNDKQGIIARAPAPATTGSLAIPGATYTGTTSQDKLIEFEVSADGLNIKIIRYRITGTEPGGEPCERLNTSTLDPSTVDTSIVDNSFSIAYTLFDMSGHFETQWQATGELTVHEPYSDGVLPCNVGPLTWTATVPSPTPPPAPGPGQLMNCPQSNKWAISVWNGPNDVDTQTALATCPDTPVAAAYWLDPSSQGWLRYFQGRPEISNLPMLDNMQGVIALGGAAAPAPTPSPTPTATPTQETGYLPPPQEVGHISASGNAVVTISNDTPYTLTLEFQGPTSETVTIGRCDSCHTYSFIGPIFCPSGRPEETVTLLPGTYDVTARVDDPSVIPFAGDWTLEGDTEYFHCFYIVTTFG